MDASSYLSNKRPVRRPVLAVVAAVARSLGGTWRDGAVDEIGASAGLAREQDRLHEVRATVAGLTTSYRLLHSADPIPPSRRDRLEALHGRELSRLERLLDDQGTEEADDDLDLENVIEPLVESLRMRGHRVLRGRRGGRVRGRADDVTHVLHVLLENSARHGGGDVEVDVVDRVAYVDVHVRDHGPGVPDELTQRLFDRGVRRPGSPGQGLGLSIGRRLARDLGGDLRLTSSATQGRGAEFVLTLPASPGCSCLELPS